MSQTMLCCHYPFVELLFGAEMDEINAIPKTWRLLGRTDRLAVYFESAGSCLSDDDAVVVELLHSIAAWRACNIAVASFVTLPRGAAERVHKSSLPYPDDTLGYGFAWTDDDDIFGRGHGAEILFEVRIAGMVVRRGKIA